MAKPLASRGFSTPAGRTLELPSLGFGGAPLGNMHRPLAEADARAVVQAAWQAGIRYFDTAPLYGHGLSEARIGAGLRGRPRGAFVISTKVGRVLEPCAPGQEASGIYRDTPAVRARFDYSYDGVMRSYVASLARLGLDRVDILFVHDLEARTHGSVEAAERRLRELIDHGGWRALDELRAAGDVAAIGAGVNQSEACARLLEVADPDLFLLAGRYTLLEQGPLAELFPACERRGVEVVIGGPFNSGILARGPGATFDYAAAPPTVVARVERLAAVCTRFEVSLRAAALQFAAAHPVVLSVIPGAQTTAELADNLALAASPIPDGFWTALKAEGLLDPATPTPQGAKALAV